MERKEELLEQFKDIDEIHKKIIMPFIDDVVHIEKQLEQLKKLPFIIYNPKNVNIQKTTPAFRQFKDLFATYTNSIRFLCSLVKNDTDNDVDVVEEFIKNFNK